jgi:hypothetical protein
VSVQVVRCDGFVLANLPAPPARAGACARYCGDAAAVGPTQGFFDHPQCSAPYLALTSPTRLAAYAQGNRVTVCDVGSSGAVLAGANYNNDWQGAGWYRFTGGAGDRLATDPAAVSAASGACGTTSGGWLTVEPPPRGQLAARTVCFAANGNACASSVAVSVVTCNGFFLYNLPAPTTFCVRYCGAGAPATTAAPANATTPAPTTPAAFNAQCRAAYKWLTAPTRSAAFNDGNNGVEVCDDQKNGTVVSGDRANNDWQGPGWCGWVLVGLKHVC